MSTQISYLSTNKIPFILAVFSAMCEKIIFYDLITRAVFISFE